MTSNAHVRDERPWLRLPEPVQHCPPCPMTNVDRVLQSGASCDDAVREAHEGLPLLFDFLFDPLHPIDVVCMLAEIIASKHFYKPLSKVEGLPVDCVPDFLPVCLNIAVAANVEYAIWCGLGEYPKTENESEFIDGVHERYAAWVKEVKTPAILRSDVSDRAASIWWTCETFLRLGWNLDLERIQRRIEKVLVDNVGGDEANPRKREQVGLSVGFGMAKLLFDEGVRGAWVVSDGAVVPDVSVMRSELALRVSTGVQRDRHVEAITPELTNLRSRRSLDPAAMAELRELRDIADSLQSKHWIEALDLAAQLSGPGQEFATHRMARVIRVLPQYTAPVRAAVTYEFFGRQHRQEDVAEDFGVSRKQLRAARAVAVALIGDALAA